MNPLSNLSSTFNIIFFARACLKKAFRELRVPVCGRFYPNEGGVAGYGNRMRVKYTAKWGLQIAEMIFQTRSSAFEPTPKLRCSRTIFFLSSKLYFAIRKPTSNS